MYEKILIVASKLDLAGINITTQLSKFGKYDFYLVDKEIIFTENLDLEKLNQYDFIVFASKHVSKNKEKTIRFKEHFLSFASFPFCSFFLPS